MSNNTPKKKSFFERLAGNFGFDEEGDERVSVAKGDRELALNKNQKGEASTQLEAAVELAVDVFQTPTDIIIQAIVAGVTPENLSINITRDTVTLKGKREENRSVQQDGYLVRELYWGAFTRTIPLPAEVEIDSAEAICRNGMLMIKLPKIDKGRQAVIRVKSV